MKSTGTNQNHVKFIYFVCERTVLAKSCTVGLLYPQFLHPQIQQLQVENTQKKSYVVAYMCYVVKPTMIACVPNMYVFFFVISTIQYSITSIYMSFTYLGIISNVEMI